MNIILLENRDFTGADRAVIGGRRCAHLKKINRIRVKDRMRCGILNGDMGRGIITGISDDSVELGHIVFDCKPPPPLPVRLVLALPRPKMLRRIIETVTSLGVKDLYLINSWRVEKSFWQSPVLNPDQVRKAMILGLEQSRDTVLPKIHIRRFFSPFVKDELPGIGRQTLCLAAHPVAATGCPSGIRQPATLAIGPEGGFIDREIRTFRNCGFTICHMGPRILKVETAVPALISRLYPDDGMLQTED